VYSKREGESTKGVERVYWESGGEDKECRERRVGIYGKETV
jgi:hypothetical protein